MQSLTLWLNKWREYRDRRRSPIYDAACRFLDLSLGDPDEPLFILSAEKKAAQRELMLRDVKETISSGNVQMTIRKKLASRLSESAYLAAAVRKPGNYDFPDMTGELRANILEVVTKNDVIRSLLAQMSSAIGDNIKTKELVLDALEVKFAYSNLWMRLYNALRLIAGDSPKDKKRDWFKPYMDAQIIFAEYSIRRDIGMPSNIKTGDPAANGIGEMICYGSFEKFVIEGFSNPLDAFEEHWSKALLYDSPITKKM